jgi:DtxR family Mn-dependent transcriptional regulator
MVDPLAALLTAVALIALSVAIFWPRKGLFARFRHLLRTSSRVLTEDALKYLFKNEIDRRPVTTQEMAGALEISLDRTTTLLNVIQEEGLIVWEGDSPQLTANGREYAIHVLRAHRLWERHLADRTGYGEADWHGMAERYEHALSPDDLDALSMDLGNPSHDPHGDPIPTAEGEIESQGGIPLTLAEAGSSWRIIHVEDEPEAVYAQLVAEGLRPGMLVSVLEKRAEKISFWADGDEHVLAPILASNLTVAPVPEIETPEPVAFERLADLRQGEKGRVLHLSRACRGAERRRLLDLGLTPGTVVEAELIGPAGGPTAYRIRGALIGLRNEQAERIYMERLPQTNHESGEQQHTTVHV